VTIRVGLRFEKSEAAKLRTLGTLRGANPALAVRVAEDCAKGEPTLVTAANEEEVMELSASFGRLGVKPPSIEVLSGHRKGHTLVPQGPAPVIARGGSLWTPRNGGGPGPGDPGGGGQP
jgi:hypothetical protein